MPLGQSQDISQADPGGRVSSRFWHRLIRFRHFIGGSLALASLNLACRDHVPTFPQRSPPSLLTTAARGGLRSTHLIAELEGPSFISRTVAHAVWTGHARDTRPIAEVARRPQCVRNAHHNGHQLERLSIGQPRNEVGRMFDCIVVQ
jgi:hypothetical protein